MCDPLEIILVLTSVFVNYDQDIPYSVRFCFITWLAKISSNIFLSFRCSNRKEKGERKDPIYSHYLFFFSVFIILIISITQSEHLFMIAWLGYCTGKCHKYLSAEDMCKNCSFSDTSIKIGTDVLLSIMNGMEPQSIFIYFQNGCQINGNIHIHTNMNLGRVYLTVL